MLKRCDFLAKRAEIWCLPYAVDGLAGLFVAIFEEFVLTAFGHRCIILPSIINFFRFFSEYFSKVTTIDSRYLCRLIVSLPCLPLRRGLVKVTSFKLFVFLLIRRVALRRLLGEHPAIDIMDHLIQPPSYKISIFLIFQSIIPSFLSHLAGLGSEM